MITKTQLLLILPLALMTVPVLEAETTGGGSPYAFYKLPLGARGKVLGAYESLVNDGSAGYWNPAGYATVPVMQFFTSGNSMTGQEDWQTDYTPTHSFISFAFRPAQTFMKPIVPDFLEESVWAFTANTYQLFDFERTHLVGGNVVESGSTFEDLEMEVAAHFAMPLFSDLAAAGMSAGLMYHDLANYTATGFSVAFGLQVNISESLGKGAESILWLFKDVRIGVASKLFTEEVWTNTSYQASGIHSVALSSSLIRAPYDNWLITGGIRKQGLYQPSFRGGSEYIHLFKTSTSTFALESVSLRAGISGIYLTERDDDVNGGVISAIDARLYTQSPAAGFGMKFKLASYQLGMQFGYELGELGGKGHMDVQLQRRLSD
jgi:hypothetical protein